MIDLNAIDDFFPSPDSADEEGIIGLSYDIDPVLILSAYKNAIFPWPFEEESILWCSPPERGIIDFKNLHIPSSVKRMLNKNEFTFSFNKRFCEVIEECAKAKRKNQEGTWITQKIIDAYIEANKLGFAISFEAIDKDGNLAGGMYGIRLGQTYFAGESMFHKKTGASKFALVSAINHLKKEGLTWMDTQMVTPLTASFGAVEIPRNDFIERLNNALPLK